MARDSNQISEQPALSVIIFPSSKRRLVDCLFSGCLMPSDKCFMHCQDENKINNKKKYT
jgi:hypothetical protein